MTIAFFLHLLKDVLLNTLSITSLVMVMLLLVEFVNVSSSGKWMQKIQHRPFLQVIVAALMGLIPGCLGGFAVVSLFTHKIFSFGALVAGMISGFGDEAFIMFAFSPTWTLFLALCLLIIGIIAGSIVALFYKKKNEIGHTFELHEDCSGEHHHASHQNKLSIKNLKNMSLQRAILLLALILYLFFILTGTFNHNHGLMPELHHHADTEIIDEQNIISSTHDHYADCNHDHHDECQHHDDEYNHSPNHAHAHSHGIFSWENILFITLALITLFIVALTSDHFLNSHLWEHVIKQHFLSVFLWTFSVLLLMNLLFEFVDINTFIAQNQWTLLILLLFALLVGIIPESGPHIIFVVMFFSGAIPFSILLANSIVQDGHSALPLLAESRKNFLLMKSINVLVGLIVGLAGYFLGF